MKAKYSISVKLLLICTLIQGISGIIGGNLLVPDPSGGSLKISLLWIADSPFKNYFIPGLILFTILGLFPLIITFGLIKKKQWSVNGSVLIAAALLIWIIVEIILIGYKSDPQLQLLCGIFGGIILFLAILNKSQSE